MNPITEITSIESYVEKFSAGLAKKVAQHAEPLHDPLTQPNHPLLAKMATPLLEKQKHAVTGGVKELSESGLLILGCNMGTGKAQANHCKVLTPSGWIPIGEIKRGHIVCTPDGGRATVTGVFPQGTKEVMRVTFTDGSSTLCCSEHLWAVNTPTRKHTGKPMTVRSLGELIASGIKEKNGNLKYYIPITKPTYGKHSGGSINPYLLGYLIGNGCLTGSSVRVTIPDEESVGRISEMVSNFIDGGVILKKKTGDTIEYSITHERPGVTNHFKDALTAIGLMGRHSYGKHIPRKLFTVTPACRESLLQGLLDSDGSVERGGNTIEYSTASKQLGVDVIALVQSLGGVATMVAKTPTYTYKGAKKTGLTSYRIMICLPNEITPFRLSRKAERYKPRTKYHPTRGITRVEAEGNYHCTCIRLDSKDQLYITDDYIVTHNTPQGIAATHCHANGNPYRALVICPPHLITKWREEIHKFLGGGVQATIIEDWRQFLQLRYAPPPAGAVWYIMAMTTAKLGYTKRCATNIKTKEIYSEELHSMVKIQAHCCPRCGYMAFNKKGLPATEANIEDGWLKCTGKWCKDCGVSYHHDLETCPGTLIRDGEKTQCGRDLRPCGEPLWQQKNHKISPHQYIKSRGCRLFDYFIRDECHESKGNDSMDGHCALKFATETPHSIFMTGTLLAGKSEDIRPMLFRKLAKKFLAMGFGWKDEIPFGKRYGRIQTVVRSSHGGTKRKSGTGSSKSSTQDIKPGIMPHLYPDFIANHTIFMSLPEMATELPSYHEETVRIDMDPTMQAEYLQMQTECLSAFRSLYVNSPGIAMKLMGPMLEAFMTWPDVPYGRKAVGYTLDNNFTLVYQPPNLDRSTIYPKEKELIAYIKAEKAQRRKCWVFSVRDDTRDRLQEILIANGLTVASLKATVKPSTRIDWLRKNCPAADVGLCHPELVQTGLELFGPGFNFPTLLWYSTGFKLNVLRQASKRAWRIGQKEACKTVYFYYGDSAQQTAVGVMAAKLVAAEAIEGKFSDGGLADESVDDDVALTVARRLADNIKTEVAAKYKPIEASATSYDRLTMLRNKIAAFRSKQPRAT